MSTLRRAVRRWLGTSKPERQRGLEEREANRRLQAVQDPTKEDRDPVRRRETQPRANPAPITRPHRSTGRVPPRGDRAEPEATDKARRAGAPHADGS